MPIVDYPFLRSSPGAPLRPMLTIRITNPDTGQFIQTYGVVDTGADECALPAALAGELGHNLTAGKIKKIQMGNGITDAYAHTCKVEIFDTHALQKGKEDVVYTIDGTPIDFMPNLHCALLGVGNFLSQFILTVDYPQQMFSVRKP
jgi:hypothetical protein